MPAIRTEALTKDFPVGFWRKRVHRALDGLTLSVDAGEVFGFLGPNGAGKTTTLKLLMQLIFPTSGVAEILGRPAGAVDVRRRIGYLPETPYFYDNLTAEELLLYFAKLFGQAPADRRRRVDRLLDEVGIGSERRQVLRRFSKGMLQRVGVAQALLNDPEVVFLDEPMSGLDPIGRRQIRELILDLRRQGRTVFFSSHILADAESVCSQAGVLVGGRLVSVGRIDEMLAVERGWELVVADLSETAQRALGARARRITQIAHGRHALEIAPNESDQFVRDCIEGGAHVVALNPLHATLEEFFLRAVQDDERGHEGAPSNDSRAPELGPRP